MMLRMIYGNKLNLGVHHSVGWEADVGAVRSF